MTSGRKWAGSKRVLVALGWLLVFGSVSAIGFGGLLYAMNASDIWVLCDHATPSGHTLQNASTTMFPVGVACEWTDLDGNVYVRTIQESWTTTALLCGGCVGLMLAVGVLIVTAARRG